MDRGEKLIILKRGKRGFFSQFTLMANVGKNINNGRGEKLVDKREKNWGKVIRNNFLKNKKIEMKK